MQRLAYGPSAWILDDVADPAGLALAIRHAGLDGVHEVIPAESTVVVICRRESAATVGERLDGVEPTVTSSDAGDRLTIEVVYDGDDLEEVAGSLGSSVEDVIRRHHSGEYRVAFCGFSPGFGYLTGLDSSLHLPRRATPRTRVPEGAVAIAAGYSAVYPSPSPGGWHLIGHTDARLWDTNAESPAALWPGRRVQFLRAAR